MKITFDIDDLGSTLIVNAKIECGAYIPSLAVVLEANSPAPLIFFSNPIGLSAAAATIQQVQSALTSRSTQVNPA